jgi:very-short-patch-repair endonuclease
MALKSLERSCYIYREIWSVKNELRPEEVAISSGKKFWFDCKKCNHDYEQSPNKKTNNGCGCPFCSNQKRCGSLECTLCLPKSCYIYKEIWSSRNSLQPEEVAISSGKKFWFNCLVCPHEYIQVPYDKISGKGCPYCSKSNVKLCGLLSCNFCLQKSCHIYRDIWGSHNLLQPEQVAISSGKKFWFNCKNCSHDYDQSPYVKTRGSGCPTCKNKTEKMVADFLKEFLIAFEKEFKLNSNKRYDFCLQEYKLIIEVDGDQHFIQVSNWKSPEETLENDIQKTKMAIDNGYSVLRIYQPDIFNERLDWRQTILDNLKLREKPVTICISSNPEIYNRHS